MLLAKGDFSPISFTMRFTNEDVVIRSTVAWPQQFPLGTLKTMTSLLERVGMGWDNIDVDNISRIVWEDGRML